MVQSDDAPLFGGGTPGWLFRGSDAAWDVLSASLASDPTLPAPWPIAPSGPSMAAGDRVLLWRSGRDGGIAAVCTVLDEPVATVTADARPDVTVDIRVERAFERPIAPAELLAHAALRPLAFMDLLETTEQRVSPAQASLLAGLIDARDAQDTGSIDGRIGGPHDAARTTIEVPTDLVPLVNELLDRLGASESAPHRAEDVQPAGARNDPTDLQLRQATQAARVHGTDEFTVDEVAATWRTGVGTARSRIERLLESGLIERSGTRSPAQQGPSAPTRGRPPVLYRLLPPEPLEP
jgi:hypothetical protein